LPPGIDLLDSAITRRTEGVTAMFEIIRECLVTALRLNPTETEFITATTTASDIEKWNSLNHLKLILELERRLNLDFEDDEIVELGSVDAIMETVKRKQR
jgi:acyl carrier protein